MPSIFKAPTQDVVYCTDSYVWTFQTDFNPASHGTFDPTILYGGSGTIIWRFENGTFLSGSAISTTGTTQGLDGTVQTVIVEIPDASGVTGLDFNTDRIYGTIVLPSAFSSLASVRLETNPTLTTITNPGNSAVWSQYWCNNCAIAGTLNLSAYPRMGGDIRVNNNAGLTAVTFPSTLSTTPLTRLQVNNCALTSLDISKFTPTTACEVVASFNTGLTTFTRPATMTVLSLFFSSCRLSTFSMTGITWTGGGTFNIDNQTASSLTSITGTSTGNLAQFLHASSINTGTGTLTANYWNWSGSAAVFSIQGSRYSSVNHGSQTGTVRTYRIDGCTNAGYWTLPFTLSTTSLTFNFANITTMSVGNVNNWFMQLDSKLTAGTGTISANLGTPAASGAGVTAANSLVSKGYTVVRT